MLDFLAAIGLVIYILGGFVILKALIKEKDLSFWFFLLPLYLFSVGILCGIILLARETSFANIASWMNLVAAIVAIIFGIKPLSNVQKTKATSWISCISGIHLIMIWFLMLLH